MLSYSLAMVKRPSSYATKVMPIASTLSWSKFWRATIRPRASRTDRPGRYSASVGVARSAMEQADWHYLAKERFAGELADALYRHAHANLFDKLVIIAPPKILGNLRKAFHPEVAERIAVEISKELTSHPVAEIGRLLAA